LHCLTFPFSQLSTRFTHSYITYAANDLAIPSVAEFYCLCYQDPAITTLIKESLWLSSWYRVQRSWHVLIQ